MNLVQAKTDVKNLADVLREQARQRPEQPAIIDSYRGRTRTTTFAALERQASQAAALLWDAGLRPGDAVLVLQPMSLELYVALIALFRSGMTAMFVDPSAGVAKIERCCAFARPRAFIGSPRAHLLRLLSPALRRIPCQFAVGASVPGAIPWRRAAALTPRDEIVACGPDTPALLTFTSGSTGAPKAMLRSHRFLLAQHRVLERNFLAVPGGVSLTALPVFVLADLASGTTSLLPPGNLRAPGRIDPAPVVAQILRYRPDRAAASPAFWERVASYCREHDLVLPSPQAIHTGGGPVFPRLLDDLHACAPRAEIVAVYGSTEAEPIAHVARGAFLPDDIPAMRGGAGLLAGRPIPEIRLRILPDRWGTPLGPYSSADFARQCLPPGQPGEIVVSGEHVASGYVGGVGDEETKLRVDGTVWHRTGDAGYLDGAGRLWLLGRCAARIQDADGTLYPFAVECAASASRAVRRSALIAHQGRRRLLVEPARWLHADDLRELRASLSWASLDAITLRPHIPVDRRHNTKIDYAALKHMLAIED
jgi:acyl-CoA synthetase (AMP-forming)/AMP-acid ligase II